jgi:hypothetical protein
MKTEADRLIAKPRVQKWNILIVKYCNISIYWVKKKKPVMLNTIESIWYHILWFIS